MAGVEKVVEILAAFSPLEATFSWGLLLLASVIRGITGFGFSAIVVTGLSFILEPAQVVVLALLLEVVASVHLLPKAWRNIDWKLLGALGTGFAIGTPVGVSLLAWLDPEFMRIIISCMVLFFAMMIFRGFSYTGPRTHTVHCGLGLVSGVCNGTAALGGLPVVTFLLSTNTSIATTRATLIAAFFGTDLFALFIASGHGMVTSTVLVYALVVFPVLFVGLAIGQQLYYMVNRELFKRLTLILLLVLSVAGLLRGILVLAG